MRLGLQVRRGDARPCVVRRVQRARGTRDGDAAQAGREAQLHGHARREGGQLRSQILLQHVGRDGGRRRPRADRGVPADALHGHMGRRGRVPVRRHVGGVVREGAGPQDEPPELGRRHAPRPPRPPEGRRLGQVVRRVRGARPGHRADVRDALQPRRRPPLRRVAHQLGGALAHRLRDARGRQRGGGRRLRRVRRRSTCSAPTATRSRTRRSGARSSAPSSR